MKPKTLDVAADYRLTLLWLMDKLRIGRRRDILASFEEEFGDIIPPAHREQDSSGSIKWQKYASWARVSLMHLEFMGSAGHGIWTISSAGEGWLRRNLQASSADLEAFRQLAKREGLDKALSQLDIQTQDSQSADEAGFRWRGEDYSVTKRALFSQARQLLKDDRPKEALRFRGWAVFVGEQPVSVKWLFALATGADYNEFDSPTARRALSQIGIEAQQVGEEGKPDPVPTQRERGASRVERRDEFFAQFSEHLASSMPGQANQGKIQFVPGRNFLRIAYAEFPRSHYELRLARGFDEVGFHLEGKRDDNLARLVLLEPHQERLTDALGHPVVAERWGQNWARLAIDLPTASWTHKQAQEYALLLARFVEATYPALQDAFAAIPSRRRSRAKKEPVSSDSPEGQAHAILNQQLAQIQTFLKGRSARPSDEVLCDWVQFCYTFEMFDEGHELFKLVAPSAVNDWLYGRTKRLAQVCRIRAQNKG